MTTLKTVAKAPGLSYKMLPYRKGDVDYGGLNFSPDLLDVPPDHMEQGREIREVLNLLSARFTDFDRSPDVFLDADTNICYNPRDLNVRVAPDVYLVFGVDAEAIHPRKIYLPWEAGKVPDWVLEVASESTGQQDVNRKPNIYAQIGIPEYWMFDPTGGRYHRQRMDGGGYHPQPLYGGRLVDGRYQPIELTTEPDGILKGYSEILELSLAWDEGWPRFTIRRRALIWQTGGRNGKCCGRSGKRCRRHWNPASWSGPLTRKGYGNWKRSCAVCARKAGRNGS